MTKPLHIITSVWGPGHIEWMERALIRSLCWPRNNSVLKNAVWHIFTRPDDIEKVVNLASQVGVKEIRIGELPRELVGTPRQMGLILLQVFLHVMDECLKADASLLTAPPDTIFSDGTIPNLIQLAKHGNRCVAVPHARVNPSIFGALNDQTTSAPELVNLLGKHGHEAWKGAEIGANNQSTFVGGIAWERMSGSEKTWTMYHMLPTIYLANFVKSDHEFFQTYPERYKEPGEAVYGCFDHIWPDELVSSERQVTPGSTDLGCILEVTKEQANIPAKVESNPNDPLAFWRNIKHNRHNRMIAYTLRGE